MPLLLAVIWRPVISITAEAPTIRLLNSIAAVQTRFAEKPTILSNRRVTRGYERDRNVGCLGGRPTPTSKQAAGGGPPPHFNKTRENLPALLFDPTTALSICMFERSSRTLW
jgi:hypothetical protein